MNDCKVWKENADFLSAIVLKNQRAEQTNVLRWSFQAQEPFLQWAQKLPLNYAKADCLKDPSTPQTVSAKALNAAAISKLEEEAEEPDKLE